MKIRKAKKASHRLALRIQAWEEMKKGNTNMCEGPRRRMLNGGYKKPGSMKK